ncbi:N-acetylneuraminate epimerase [Photobacterium phosphoreum]|uniref:N-acetylneuraminate epimerase n=1 Tax=Photobacterium phosphoreum TaxID=659 RepID=UPI000D181371|nr:N-acetylneuraminate epimerase [Photobacterium phosphoreum]MCD9517910.1 YjhT family mutarotase [Photobacterium phosphoreum]PSU37950.1 N-acetylneuraminic acid mutarotase [Photobacterium phosphoreum]
MKKSCTRFAMVCSLFSLSTSVMAEQLWPDLPQPIKNGISAQTDNMVFVGLGAAGQSFYAMDTASSKPQWKKLADFIGPVPDQATAAAVAGKIYVFSGSGKVESTDKAPVIFDSVYVYDINNNTWSKQNTRTPVGLLGASAYPLNQTEIAIFGGYNKQQFDQYLHAVSTIDKDTEPQKWQQTVTDFMQRAPEDYQWNQAIQIYNTDTNNWSTKGNSPYLANCGAALVGEGDRITLISGEIKPGLRTPMVKAVTIKGSQVDWQQLASLPDAANGQLQEGVAGAYAGKNEGALIVAGGANFIGARGKAEQGDWFAHDGLSKHWSEDIYTYRGDKWALASTKLPQGLAYGASFSTPAGVLMVGGENATGKPQSKVYMLRYEQSDVSIID